MTLALIVPVALAVVTSTPAEPGVVLVPSVGELAGLMVAAVGEEGTTPTPEAPPAGASVEEAPAAGGEGAATGEKTGLAVARRVAVYELELQGVEKNIGTVVTDSLLAEIRKLEGVSAIGMDEIKDMLSHEANKQILGCEADDSCLAEIAGALGVDDLITGALSKVGDQHVILVRRIDQRGAQVVGVFDKRLKAESGQEFLLSVGPAVEELFPDRNVRVGLSRGVAKEVALRLDPPPLPTGAFWGVAGSAAAALAAGGVFGILAETEASSYRTLLTQNPVEGSILMGHYRNAVFNSTAANVSWAVSGALAIGAGVMFLFTDWEGYGDQAE